MAGRLLLDTNAVIALLSGDKDVQLLLADSPEVFLPVVALGELLFGAQKSSRPADNLRRVEEFTAAVSLLPCDRQTAHSYAILKAQLRTAGKPIPENDLWVAATAHQHRLTLLTRDAHFAAVNGLACTSW